MCAAIPFLPQEERGTDSCHDADYVLDAFDHGRPFPFAAHPNCNSKILLRHRSGTRSTIISNHKSGTRMHTSNWNAGPGGSRGMSGGGGDGKWNNIQCPAFRATNRALYYFTRFLSSPILWTAIHTTPIIGAMQQTLLALAGRIKYLRKKDG